jgi:hypothetical protein
MRTTISLNSRPLPTPTQGAPSAGAWPRASQALRSLDLSFVVTYLPHKAVPGAGPYDRGHEQSRLSGRFATSQAWRARVGGVSMAPPPGRRAAPRLHGSRGPCGRIRGRINPREGCPGRRRWGNYLASGHRGVSKVACTPAAGYSHPVTMYLAVASAAFEKDRCSLHGVGGCLILAMVACDVQRPRYVDYQLSVVETS